MFPVDKRKFADTTYHLTTSFMSYLMSSFKPCSHSDMWKQEFPFLTQLRIHFTGTPSIALHVQNWFKLLSREWVWMYLKRYFHILYCHSKHRLGDKEKHVLKAPTFNNYHRLLMIINVVKTFEYLIQNDECLTLLSIHPAEYKIYLKILN